MLRNRVNVDELFNSFHGNTYRIEQQYLIRQISNSLSNVVQDELCRAGQTHGVNANQRLHDILCEMSYHYTPINDLDHRNHKNGLITPQHILGAGANGEVYHNLFHGNPFIVKVPFQFDRHYITELFINFNVINPLLLNNLLVNHLVPTYGFFLCQGRNQDENIPICRPEQPNETNRFFLIQRRVQGDTLLNLLVNGTINTVAQLQPLLLQIFTVLIVLEECNLHISHNDLHCENIMIEGGNAYIIDYGHASFIIRNATIQHNYFGETTGGRYVNLQNQADRLTFHTGANDYYKLLHSIGELGNHVIRTYIRGALVNFERNFWYMGNNDQAPRRFIEFEHAHREQCYNTVLLLLEGYREGMSPYDRLHTDPLNVASLRRLTMRQLCNDYFPGLIDMNNVNELIARLNVLLGDIVENIDMDIG
jgi:serine/threonine protein kinase